MKNILINILIYVTLADGVLACTWAFAHNLDKEDSAIESGRFKTHQDVRDFWNY